MKLLLSVSFRKNQYIETYINSSIVSNIGVMILIFSSNYVFMNTNLKTLNKYSLVLFGRMNCAMQNCKQAEHSLPSARRDDTSQG